MRVRVARWVWAVAAIGAIACGDDASDAAQGDAGATPRARYGRDGGRCGDGVLDRGEACDGIVIGQSCESLGMERGPLTCTSRCTLDTSGCGDNPRPPPPRRPDGGLDVPDPDFITAAVCSEIVRCGEVPLPVAEDGVSELLLGLGSHAYCASNLDGRCADCVAGTLDGRIDQDAGAGCGSDCNVACFGLSVPRLSSLLAPARCEAAAGEFVDGFDAACLCAECAAPLHACLSDVLCYEALACIGATGCTGNACALTGACRDPIRALSFSSNTVALDSARQCIETAGCRAP